MAIVLPRGILKNYYDEHVRRHIIMKCRVVAVVGLGRDMFRPYTNTKTCVLFVQRRREDLADIAEADNDPQVVYCQTTRPGKDTSGRLLHEADGSVASDLPEIAKYIKEKAVWH